MLETAWESRWMPDSIKNNSLNAIWNRTDTSEWMNYLWWGCVNLHQQGSAVSYNWFLPVIHKFELIEVVNDWYTSVKYVPWKLHIENLIQSSNWKVWNKYQDIRGVTRKCNQTNQNKQLLIVNTISQRCNAMHLRGTPYPRCESIG